MAESDAEHTTEPQVTQAPTGETPAAQKPAEPVNVRRTRVYMETQKSRPPVEPEPAPVAPPRPVKYPTLSNKDLMLVAKFEIQDRYGDVVDKLDDEIIMHGARGTPREKRHCYEITLPRLNDSGDVFCKRLRDAAEQDGPPVPVGPHDPRKAPLLEALAPLSLGGLTPRSFAKNEDYPPENDPK